MERALPTGASRDTSFRLILVLGLVLIPGCASVAPEPASIAPAIEQAISRSPFQHAFWSILVEEDDGRVLYSQNADKLTIPASNRKLFVSAAAVNCLGPDGRLVTEVWRDGEDLVIRGGGDPSLGSWRYERSEDFDRIAQVLGSRGLTHVRDVIADVSAFDRDIFPGGWKHGNLGSDYAAPVDAIAWGENEVAGDRAVADPAMHAAAALREALFMRGIEVTGTARANVEPRSWEQKVFDIPSPFVFHLLTTVLKNSHNLYAEMLLKVTSTSAPASYQSGLDRERAFLTSEVRIDGESFRFVDGSGLAPDDLVTPRTTIRLLRWMNDESRRGLWWSLLAQPNNEGTLRRRLVPLENRLRGKTGTINGVNALSGVIEMPGGRFRYFSIAVNHHAGDGDEAVKIIDEIVARIAE